MKQFPSVKARRKNVFGGGIKARYPKPGGVTLSADPETFIVDGPGFDRFKLAAMLDRANRFAQGYSDLWQRLHGSLDVDGTALPTRYRVGEPDLLFQTLWLHVTAGQNWTFGQYLPKIGDIIIPDNGAGQPVTIADVQPPFDADSIINQIVAADTTPTTWVASQDGNLCAVVVNVPLRQITYSEEISSAYPTTAPETSFLVTGQPTLQGAVLNILALATQILLWGECTAPDGINLGVGFGPPFQAGSFAADWRAYIEVCAGRVLWQMAMVETLAMVEDLENQDKGGQGGLVQQASNLFTVLPPPASLPPGPVQNPPLAWLNSALEHSAVEIVLWVVETLL